MRRRNRAIIGFLLSCFVGTLRAQTFSGPGPDPACGGTELTIVERHGRVSAIEEIIYGSNRTLAEEFSPTRSGWKITLLLFSSRWQDNEPLSKARLIRRSSFLAYDTKGTGELKKSFGYGDVDWSNEPKRLLDYFHTNRADFRETVRR